MRYSQPCCSLWPVPLWILALALPLLTSTGPAQAQSAYILVGKATVPGETEPSALIKATVEEAQRDLQKAGYSILRRDNATFQDFLSSLLDNNAIWFIGHGAYLQATGGVGSEVTADPFAAIQFNDQWATAVGIAAIRDRLGLTLDHITEVTLQACGQDLDDWRDLFPKANFNAWETATRPHMMYEWQRDHVYPAAPGTGIRSLDLGDEPPAIHPRLRQTNQIYFDAAEGVWVNELLPVANRVDPFIIPDPLASQLEGETVNLLSDDGAGPELLFSTQILNGTLGDPLSQYASQAAFDVILNGAAHRRLFQDPDGWSLLGPGEVSVVNHTGVVSNQDALRAFGTAYLGTQASPSGTAIPEPSTWVLMGLGMAALLVGRRRRPAA